MLSKVNINFAKKNLKTNKTKQKTDKTFILSYFIDDKQTFRSKSLWL